MEELKAWFAGDSTKYNQGPQHLNECVATWQSGLLGITDCTTTGTQDFKYSWLGCLEDPAVCCFACCCPMNCELFSQTMSAMQGVDKSEYCCINCGICCWAPCCVTCYHAGTRTAFRQKYDLKGSPFLDLCGSCCCAQCLVCQEARETGFRKLQRPVPWSYMGKDEENKNAGMTTKAIDNATKKDAAPAPANTVTTTPAGTPVPTEAAVKK